MRADLSSKRPTARLLARVALLTALGASAACAHRAPDTSATPGDQAAAQQASHVLIPLRIASHLSSDVVIYAVRGRMRQRIGTLSGPITRTFSIPARFASDPGGFYLVAHRIGGGRSVEANSPTVTVQPGQTVVWTLESELTESELAIE